MTVIDLVFSWHNPARSEQFSLNKGPALHAGHIFKVWPGVPGQHLHRLYNNDSKHDFKDSKMLQE
eukprot:5348674-Amphidinium_carterae.2